MLLSQKSKFYIFDSVNEKRELIPIESYINPPAFYKKEDQSINRERNHYWTGAISVLLYIENN